LAGKAAMAGKGASVGVKAGGTAKALTGGSIWTGKGLGLGLGLGLGPWATVALGVLGAVAVYGYLRNRESNTYDESETDLEIQEALA
jgi:hypothetical protein